MDFGSLIGPLIALLATGVGGWIGSRIIRPRDHERAALLSRIATDAAALVVAMFPKASWPELLKAVVDQIAAAAGTKNRPAIERAAAAALTALGKNPGATP